MWVSMLYSRGTVADGLSRHIGLDLQMGRCCSLAPLRLAEWFMGIDLCERYAHQIRCPFQPKIGGYASGSKLLISVKTSHEGVKHTKLCYVCYATPCTAMRMLVLMVMLVLCHTILYATLLYYTIFNTTLVFYTVLHCTILYYKQ